MHFPPDALEPRPRCAFVRSGDERADVLRRLNLLSLRQCRDIHETIYELYVNYAIQTALAG